MLGREGLVTGIMSFTARQKQPNSEAYVSTRVVAGCCLETFRLAEYRLQLQRRTVDVNHICTLNHKAQDLKRQPGLHVAAAAC